MANFLPVSDITPAQAGGDWIVNAYKKNPEGWVIFTGGTFLKPKKVRKTIFTLEQVIAREGTVLIRAEDGADDKFIDAGWEVIEMEGINFRSIALSNI